MRRQTKNKYIMNAIGFKNFRNFVEFPTMPTNGVTILVGGNNAGKSTCTKAYRLLAQNLEKFINEGVMTCNEDNICTELQKFDFSSVCGNFERALSKSATEDIIEINTQMSYFDITLRITSKNKKNIYAHIQSIEIKDILDDCSWSWTNDNQQTIFTYTGKTIANIIKQKEFWRQEKIRRGERLVETSDKGSNKIIEIINKLQDEVNSIKEIQNKYKSLESVFEHKYDNLLPPFELQHQNEKIVLDGEQTEIVDIDVRDFDDMDKYGIYKEDSDARLFADFFKRVREDLKKACNHNRIVYFPAHESPLDSYFNLNHNEYDNNATSICSFYREYYNRKNWVRDRMRELGIGEDFDIELANSDYLYVTITNSDGKKIPLADNGRGAVQLFILLLRLAKYSPSSFEAIHVDPYHKDMIEYEDNHFPDGVKRRHSLTNLFIFEEPEQNMHPNLQSKLADLFLDVYKRFGINVLVETHSEYLVRRSQVLVAEAKYKDEQELAEKCPFKVYYFPEAGKGQPYDMEYQISGRFLKSFGDGFYDESAKWTSVISAKERMDVQKQDFQWETK